MADEHKVELVLLALAILALGARPAPVDASELRAGVPAEIFVAPGRATTIQLQTEEKIAAISLASPIVAYKYDRSLNQLEITPTVRSGGVETNLNLRIGPDVYILVVKVVTDVRAQFLCRFTLEGDARADDEAGLARARALKPEEVDLVEAAKTLERAETDQVFLEAHPNLRIKTLNQYYTWNDCVVGLADLAQFLDLDLLVFRVQWVNRTGDALFLDAAQYGLSVAGHRIPIIARYKVGVGSIIYPGQVETVYLAVQGYRLSRNNDWELGLPPDGAAIVRLLKP